MGISHNNYVKRGGKRREGGGGGQREGEKGEAGRGEGEGKYPFHLKCILMTICMEKIVLIRYFSSYSATLKHLNVNTDIYIMMK